MPPETTHPERPSVRSPQPPDVDEPQVPLEPERAGPPRSKFRRAKWVLLPVVLLIAAGGYLFWNRFYAGRESTDDARIDGHVTPVSAKVGGTVAGVLVNDNQQVKLGEVIVRIDPRDYMVAVERARADLAAARSGAQAAQSNVPITSTTTASRVTTAEAGVEASRAGANAAQKGIEVSRAQADAAAARVREAQANHDRAARDLARMKQLVDKDEISQQQYDAAAGTEAAARATLEAQRAAAAQADRAIAVAEAQLAQAQAGIGQSEAALHASQTGPQEVAVKRAEATQAGARIEQAQAALAQAELNLSYTNVMAAMDGRVSNKTVQVGQVIQTGQALLAIIPLEDVWVTANFKETQLHYMRPGQAAVVSVDAFGGRKYQGHIDSIAAAAAAVFSVLPPENATGNYVKVVQRVPVKIVLERGQDPEHLLRPGMSVIATVRVQ